MRMREGVCGGGGVSGIIGLSCLSIAEFIVFGFGVRMGGGLYRIGWVHCVSHNALIQIERNQSQCAHPNRAKPVTMHPSR